MSCNIFAAIALLLIVEGFLPAVVPQAWRKMVRVMAEQSDNALRISGFVFMILGALILVFLKK